MQSTRDGPPPSDASESELLDYLRRLCSDVTLVSNKDGFFPHWVDQVSAHISDNFIARFRILKTDYERIQMVWKIKPLHTLKLPQHFKPKDEAASLKLREQGNVAFKKNNKNKALVLYSQAVMSAPHSGSSLSLACGNRSAVLSSMELHRWSLRDIRLALLHGYPADLRYKLLERAGHCYEKLGLVDNAADCYQRGIISLKSAQLTKEKEGQWRKTLEGRLRGCSGDGVGVPEEGTEPAVVNDPENARSTDYKGIGEACPSQALFCGTNLSLPSASEAITIKATLEEGRYAVAAREVPGDSVLVRESPYAAVLMKDKSGAYCAYCFRRLVAAVPCDRCRGVAYCSTDCRDQSQAAHDWECGFADILESSGMSLNCYLALRIITQRPLQYFMQLRLRISAVGLLQPLSTVSTNSPDFTPANSTDEYSANKTKSTKSVESSKPSLRVPSEAEPHDSTNYLSVYNLVALEDQRDPMDFLQRTLMSILLLKILQRAGYFGSWDENSAPDKDASDQELYIGALILRNLQVLQFNAHEVSGMACLDDPPQFKRCRSLYLGLGVYPTVAFFNHSCYPAVTRHFNGRKMVVSSIRTIAPGEVVSENYGPIFTHQTKEQREKKLLSRYWFRCNCPPCALNWGTLPELPDAPRLKCPHCSEVLQVKPPPVQRSRKTKHNQDRSFKCQMCQKVVPFEQMTADMVEARKAYIAAQDEMEAGRREAAICQFTTFIAAGVQYAALPYKELHLAAQAMRLLIAARGTCALVAKE